MKDRIPFSSEALEETAPLGHTKNIIFLMLRNIQNVFLDQVTLYPPGCHLIEMLITVHCHLPEIIVIQRNRGKNLNCQGRREVS